MPRRVWSLRGDAVTRGHVPVQVRHVLLTADIGEHLATAVLIDDQRADLLDDCE
jgi:hypothetical protein